MNQALRRVSLACLVLFLLLLVSDRARRPERA